MIVHCYEMSAITPRLDGPTTAGVHYYDGKQGMFEFDLANSFVRDPTCQEDITDSATQVTSTVIYDTLEYTQSQGMTVCTTSEECLTVTAD